MKTKQLPRLITRETQLQLVRQFGNEECVMESSREYRVLCVKEKVTSVVPI